MGSAEGQSPFAWSLRGVPSDIVSSPFLARKGDRGMVERVFQQPAKKKIIRRHHMEAGVYGTDSSD